MPRADRPAYLATARPVKSADRVVEVVELLATFLPAQAVAFDTIRERLGLPRSSLHGLLTTLERRGWVHRTGAGYKLCSLLWAAVGEVADTRAKEAAS